MAKKSCSINAIQLRLIKEKVVKDDFTIKVLLICCKRFRRKTERYRCNVICGDPSTSKVKALR